MAVLMVTSEFSFDNNITNNLVILISSFINQKILICVRFRINIGLHNEKTLPFREDWAGPVALYLPA